MVVLVNRVLCAVLALAALVGSLVLVAEILAAGLDRGPWLVPYDRWGGVARRTPWSDGDVRLASGAMLAAGMAILAVQFARRRPSALPIAPTAGGADARLDRRGAERWLAERARQVAGVTVADARISRKVATVRVHTLERDGRAVEKRVHDELLPQLAGLRLERLPRVDVHVRTRSQEAASI